MKKLTSIILTLAMIFSFISVAGANGVYSDDVLKTVFNATKLIGNDVSYEKTAKITYGQLAGAAVNVFTDEYDSGYVGLNPERPFDHQYASAFFVIARDVLNKSIVLQINNPYMTVGDTQKEIDPGIGTKPIVDPASSRTLLPVRAVVEEMNGNVSWNNETREVTLQKGGSTIILAIGNKVAYLNGEAVELDCAPIIKDNRTLLPIRFIAESFGYDVGWNQAEKTIPITRKTPVALTAEEADKNATVGDAVDVLTYYLAKRGGNTVSFNKGTILEGIDKSSEITHYEFAKLLCELDDIAPLLLKVEITKDKKLTYVPVKIQKELKKYPQNASDYRVVLEELSSKAYEKKMQVLGEQKPVTNYDFARDYKSIFLGMLSPWVDAAAKQAGVDMKMTYYPVLNTSNGSSHTIRVKVDIISANGKPLISDVFKTPNDEVTEGFYFEAGKSYFCDFITNSTMGAIAENINNTEALSENLIITSVFGVQ